MLLLVAKALLVPVLLVACALVERKWGTVAGGWLMGLPLMSGPASFFLLVEHGPRFAENAAQGTLFGMVGAGVFCAGYSLAASRGWRNSLALAGFAGLGVTFALSQVHMDLGATLLTSAVLLALVAVAARPPANEVVVARFSKRGLALKMVMGSAVVVSVTVASTMLGSQASGMLAAIPMITALMVVSAHRAGGFGSARRFLQGSVAGLWGGAAFFGVVGLLVTAATPGITYLAATGAAAAVALVMGRLVTSRRFSRGQLA